MNRHGLTIIESLAAILILSIVMVTTMTILVNTRVQSLANERLLAASQVGIMLSNYIIVYMNDDANIVTLETLADEVDFDTPFGFTSNVCSAHFSTSFCENLYNRPPIGGLIFDEESVSISLVKPSGAPDVIRFTISITYYNERTIEIEVFIYVE